MYFVPITYNLYRMIEIGITFEYQMVQTQTYVLCVCAHTMNVRNLHLIGWLLKMSLINWGLSEIDEGKDNE